MFVHSRSRSSGCCRMTRTAAATLATLDGDPDAVKTYARARKWRARNSGWSDTQTPPMPASDFEERRHVAANGIQPFDDDEPVALAPRQPLQLPAQAVGRIVAEPDDLRCRLPRRVIDAGVAVAVDEDDVTRTAQAADQRQVRLIAGTEDDGVALAEPFGEVALERFVQREGAVGRARSGRSGAVVVEGAARRVDDVGMLGQSEIVVRPEHQGRASLHDDLAWTEHALDNGQPGRRRRVLEHREARFDCTEFVEQIHL